MFHRFHPARLLGGMAFLGLVTLFRPAAGDWFFTDLIHWPRAYQLLQTEQQRTETLDEINLRLRQRMRHKEHLITLLIEGECSLAQVTEEFWQTIQSNPGYLTVLRHHFPGSTDYEKTLANVLYHAQFQIRHLPPAQQAQVWQRLEAQLGNWLEENMPGTIEVPDTATPSRKGKGVTPGVDPRSYDSNNPTVFHHSTF